MLQQETDYKRIFLAVALAALVLIVWQVMVEAPRRKAMSRFVQQQNEQVAIQKKRESAAMALKEAEPWENPSLSRTERLALSPRVAIRSGTLHGSIALKGARFDDLTLAKYRETLDKNSAEVTLFSPNGDEKAYFAQIGWLATDHSTQVPDHRSLWQADKQALQGSDTVQLRWNNGEGVTFILSIALDNDYMFTVTQQVENHSGRPISVVPYAYINRAHKETQQHYAILHEGPLGVLNGTLDEIPYQMLREKGPQVFENASGWLGITDKYWQAVLIPADTFKATFSHYTKNNKDRYQADFLGKDATITDGSTLSSSIRLFAGAKEVTVLDRYAAGNGAAPIPLFDRSVDFGSLYFLTKPMFLMLNFFFVLVGNFGVAILLLTIVVKLLLYPLANKSYHAMSQMRELQPEMLKIREKYFDDKIRLQQETMALYKREKVNPASGCLPILIQMPVFFALYKVLFVTIEMRHAPFFGWIKDLSAVDPSNIFTAFGLLEWGPPSWMHLGILPILYCVTMIIQLKQQPKPTDPVQAKMMTYMPFFLLIIFASFPAGLVVYWTWSNILSIIQQHIITKRHQAYKAKLKTKKSAA